MTFVPNVLKICTKHILTGIDGETYDIARVMWVLGVLCFLAYEGYNIAVRGQPFDMVNFGLGFGSVMAASAGAVKLKESTEPK